ncbi:MAG: hypothetical protein VCC20_00350 [Myxococcota bacterium]
MRPLEIVSLSLLGLSLLLFLVPSARRPAWARWIPGTAAIFLLLQFVFEGHRTQLDFAYPVCTGLVVASLVGPRVRWHHAIGVVLTLVGGLGLLVAFFFVAGSPMFELPEPTGPHRVGVTRLYVADREREETFTLDPNDHRELMVRVWYPAEPESGAEPVAYWEDVEQIGPLMARMLRERFGLAVRDSLADHYADIPTHSYLDARPIASPGRLPVLVYSHGYGLAGPNSNTALMEELASRGYWVASIAHTFQTPGVVFDDGRILGWSPEAVREPTAADAENWETFFVAHTKAQSPSERDELVRAFLAAQTEMNRSMHVWNADTRTVVDEIERIASGERPTPFAGRLDLDRLGVLGMSFGGATAGTFCVEDPRCKAGLNLDGFHFGEGMAEAVVSVPFMIMSSQQEGIPFNDFFFRHAAGPIHHAMIDGAFHGNFTDTSISSINLRWFGMLGEIDGHRMLEILNVYVPEFFDHYLLGEPAPLLEANSLDFPEVELESRNVGSR